MKRLVYVIVFLVLVSPLSFSQSWCLGIKGGVPLIWASGEDWDDYVDIYDDPENEFEPGIFLGAFLSYDFTDSIGMQLEGLYGIYQWDVSGETNGNILRVNKLPERSFMLYWDFHESSRRKIDKSDPGKGEKRV